MAKTQEQKDAEKAAKLAATSEEVSPAVEEFELIIESIRKERGEEYYERNKEEYDRILAKLEANPGMHFNDIGFTSYDNNKVIG